MLHHLSITVEEPEVVARVFAELTNGQYGPFMPHKGSWHVKMNEEGNIGLEFYPLGTELHPNPEADSDPRAAPEFHDNPNPQHRSGTHVALSVPRSEQEVLEIVHRAGWEATSGDRGPFRLIDVWVENRILFEIFTPPMAREYIEAPPPGPVKDPNAS